MSAAPLPDFRILHSALRRTSEHLAHELLEPREEPPEWNELEWDIARASAAMHGISAFLARRLRWQGPHRWQEFLHDQLEQGLRREARVDATLAQLDECLRRERVGAVALKGSSLRRLGLHARGERPMGDIDLLATEADFAGVERALSALGYRQAFVMRRHAIFADGPPLPPRGLGEHLDNPLKIELHARIAEQLPVESVDITSIVMPHEPFIGLADYPDMPALLAHLLLHCAGNMRAHALRLVQLLDVARLTSRLDGADWNRFLEGRGAAAPWWALPPLLLAVRYCHAAVPDFVLEAVGSAAPPWLRYAARNCELNTVSWSNLRIAAFPGVEFSRSITDLVRYARSRIAPERIQLEELAGGLRTQPHLLAVPWYDLPHHERMLLWLLGRAPRVQTLHSVMAAVESGYSTARSASSR
jgi:hypothetical protein